MQRCGGRAILLVDHANNKGEQRGTNPREDMLDLVMAIRRPTDYQPAEGARFEIHFEKACCLFGEAAKPIEAHCKSTRRASRAGTGGRSTTTISTASWSCSKLGLNASQVACELGISRSQSYHLLTHARQFDMLRR